MRTEPCGGRSCVRTEPCDGSTPLRLKVIITPPEAQLSHISAVPPCRVDLCRGPTGSALKLKLRLKLKLLPAGEVINGEIISV